MHQHRVSLAAFFSLFAVACGGDTTTTVDGEVTEQDSNTISISASGPVTDDVRSVSTFGGVDVGTSLDATLGIGAQDVVINAEANVLEHVTTEVRDQTLRVSVEPNVSLSNAHVSARITNPSIDRVTARQSANVHGAISSAAPTVAAMNSSNVQLTLDATGLVSVNASSSSTVTLSGTAGSLELKASDSATVTSALPVASATVDASNSATVEIRASNEVHITVSNSAAVVVHGNPITRDVHTKTSGSVVFVD